MKKNLLIFFITQFVFSQTNVQNEVGVKNTQIFYFNHSFSESIQEGEDFFKPYLSFLKNSSLETYEPNSKLMDSFLLYDSYFFNPFWLEVGSKERPYDGSYNIDDTNNYLSNLFDKTKVPIINENTSTNNKYGVLGNNKNSSLAYKFNLESNATTISLDFRARAKNWINDDNMWGEIYIGIQFFNNTNEVILTNPDDYYNMSENRYMGLEYTSNPNIWEHPNPSETFENILIPSNAVSAKLYIMNYNHGIDSFNCLATNSLSSNCVDFQNSYSEIFIDNVILIDNNGHNYINPNNTILNDSEFNVEPINSNWEFIKRYNKEFQYLFVNREPLLNSIMKANNELNNDRIKIIPTLPSIHRKYYDPSHLDYNPIHTDELLLRIDSFIEGIDLKFNDWKIQNQDVNIELFGMYFVDELIKGGKATLLKPILEHIKSKLSEVNLKLIGSPYLYRFNPCSFETTFDNSIINLYDIVYQQPSSFYSNFNGPDTRDRELLRMANNFASSKNININIESRVLEDDELYGRINDYFDYGDKYGYINYSKLYYDATGAHYLNSHSNNINERKDYENLYKFIYKSKNGVLINNKFEILDEENNSLLHNWVGDYNIKHHVFSQSSSNRELKKQLSNQNNYYSQDIPIKENENYKITCKVKEGNNISPNIDTDGSINSALIGVIFYDNQNNKLLNLNTNYSNLTYSTSLNNYFVYFDTKSDYRNFNFFFNAPTNAVKFRFYLRKWHDANLSFKNIRFIESENLPTSRLIYDNTFLNKLSLENEFKYGNNSLSLDKNEYALSKEKISITANKNYEIKLSTKENLPIGNFNRENKALIAIETFNALGEKIVIPQINNFRYSSYLEMHFKYINNINQVWNDFSVDINFPNDVASIKVYIYNWFYDNIILIDNVSFQTTEVIQINAQNNNNLFKKEKWSEKFPLIASYNKPVFYEELIDVNNVSKLKFSALLRDTNTSFSSNRDLFAIEFYDNNYNLLTDEEISSQTNWNWSPYYKFWWQHYFEINSTECLNDDNWVQNQWEWFGENDIDDLSKVIDVPAQASYIGFSFHKHSVFNEDLLILNPILEDVSGINSKKINKNNIYKNKYSVNNLIIYPNPSKNEINVKFLEKNIKNLKYTIFDINGKLITNGNLNNSRKINVSKIENGVYYIIIKNKKTTFKAKFIKL